jgi:hypothetical protein
MASLQPIEKRFSVFKCFTGILNFWQKNNFFLNKLSYLCTQLGVTTLSIMTFSIAMLCYYADYHNAFCRILFIVMLNIVRLRVIAPSTVLGYLIESASPVLNSPRALSQSTFCVN